MIMAEVHFIGCTNLKIAPVIPSGVTDMCGTFSGCANLQGTIEINANPSDYNWCFENAAINETGLTVSTDSKITKGQ